MTKEQLADEGYEYAVVFDNPDFGDSIIGIDSDNRAVYSLEKMIDNLMISDNMTYEEAAEFIDYNTIRSLPYQENSPIVVNLFEEI